MALNYGPDDHSRAAYERRMLAEWLLYAYARATHSSRQIERRRREDLAFMAIAGRRVPAHSTIAECRRRHETALVDLFGDVLAVCARPRLVRGAAAFEHRHAWRHTAWLTVAEQSRRAARIARPGCASGGDLLSKNAGLRIGPAPSGHPALAFAKLQVSEPTAKTASAPTTLRGSLLATSRLLSSLVERTCLAVVAVLSFDGGDAAPIVPNSESSLSRLRAAFGAPAIRRSTTHSMVNRYRRFSSYLELGRSVLTTVVPARSRERDRCHTGMRVCYHARSARSARAGGDGPLGQARSRSCVYRTLFASSASTSSQSRCCTSDRRVRAGSF